MQNSWGPSGRPGPGNSYRLPTPSSALAMFWCNHPQKFHLQLKKERKKKNNTSWNALHFLKLIYGYVFTINSAPDQIQNL